VYRRLFAKEERVIHVERPIFDMGERFPQVGERIFHMENLIFRIEKNNIRPGTITDNYIVFLYTR